MPKQLLFLLLHFGLRNHQAIYFFFFLFLCQQVHAGMYNDLCFTVITRLYMNVLYMKFFDMREKCR